MYYFFLRFGEDNIITHPGTYNRQITCPIDQVRLSTFGVECAEVWEYKLGLLCTLRKGTISSNRLTVGISEDKGIKLQYHLTASELPYSLTFKFKRSKFPIWRKIRRLVNRDYSHDNEIVVVKLTNVVLTKGDVERQQEEKNGYKNVLDS